jgi:16S rRNA processing protein RimM
VSSGAPPEDERSALAVADVVTAHGLRGLLRLRPYQFPAPSLVVGRDVLLDHAGTLRPARIATVAPHGGRRLLVGLEGVTDRSAAEALAGARVLVRRGDLPPPDADEFYWHEVTGWTVETDAGTRLGDVVETFATGLNDVWVVRDADREVLIPVIADVVRSIDRDARRIVVTPLPGLLD